MLKHFLLFSFFITFTFQVVYSQSIENWISSNEKIPAEKIYIHTDSENYFTGDTLWFKIYLIDSRSGQLLPGAENVYVNLLNEAGQSVNQSLLLSVKGQASGKIAISDKLRSGNYLLQAHTNYLLNFGPQSFFYKHITISTISGSSRMTVKSNPSGNMIENVHFLPEGGVLLENSTNLVAFKATDKFGYGVEVSGKIKDSKGSVVTSFSSDFKGMGLLFLMPESDKKYYATIDGFPKFRHEFNAVKNGVKIQLVNHTSTEVILNISGNSQTPAKDEYSLINMYRGEVLFYQNFKMEGVNKVLRIKSNLLKPGINELLLLDKDFQPVSERLVFSENFEKNNLFVEADKKLYDKKSKVKINIRNYDFSDSLSQANLSVAVVHELTIPEGDFSKNIFSQLLIDSEINGFVESSKDFLNDSVISSEAKLRLLMLTTDHDNYFWNTAPFSSGKLEFRQESGINISGIAANTLSNNIIKNGEITMAIQKDEELAFLTQNTDSLGRFIFKGLLFNDSAKIHVQAKTQNGKMNVDVMVDTIFQYEKPTDAQLNILRNKTTDRRDLASLKYQVHNEKRKNRVKGKASKRQNRKKELDDDGHIRLYESADFVLEVDPNEQSYSNVLDYMVGKIPGVDVGIDFVRIRGTRSYNNNSLPLFLLDGVPLVGSQSLDLQAEITQLESEDLIGSDYSNSLIQTVQAIPLTDVDKIEVLKSSQNTSLYGVKGSNGVVAIYTRHGEQPDGIIGSKGIIEKQIAGYLPYAVFNSPEYAVDSSVSKTPDLRTLLYWNPEVELKNGETEIQFYSSMQNGKYKVIVEGITGEGKICVGSADFEVK